MEETFINKWRTYSLQPEECLALAEFIEQTYGPFFEANPHNMLLVANRDDDLPQTRMTSIFHSEHPKAYDINTKTEINEEIAYHLKKGEEGIDAFNNRGTEEPCCAAIVIGEISNRSVVILSIVLKLGTGLFFCSGVCDKNDQKSTHLCIYLIYNIVYALTYILCDFDPYAKLVSENLKETFEAYGINVSAMPELEEAAQKYFNSNIESVKEWRAAKAAWLEASKKQHGGE